MKKLEVMPILAASELGLERGRVMLALYSPLWADFFRAEKESLSRILGTSALAFEHIGSTSIPGMVAKPIIDMMVAVRGLNEVEDFLKGLCCLGYQDRGSGGAPDRRYFVKGKESRRTHHLNFTEFNSGFWKEHTLFRDYLRTHPEVAAEYSSLKQALAQEFHEDRASYTSSKEEFVQSVLLRAVQER
jgi:GrpB-like predicted nucleotidyltransferase (UPF0157 family)